MRNALRNFWRNHVVMTDPHDSLSVLDIRDGVGADCRCGHTLDVHQHYRDGSDCSQCECRHYSKGRR